MNCLPRSQTELKAIDAYIGRRIREERVKRGMSQGDLAQRIGITYQQAHKYEKGVNRTSASRLLSIAEALGVDVTELLPAPAGSHTSSMVGRRELELARNFSCITNDAHRQAVCDLVRSLIPAE